MLFSNFTFQKKINKTEIFREKNLPIVISMSEPRQKRIKSEDVSLESFPDAVNDRLIAAAKAWDSKGIYQALREGAKGDLQIDGVPLVELMRQDFLSRVSQLTPDDVAKFIHAIKRLPNYNRDLGEDWAYMLAKALNFEQRSSPLLQFSTPKWIGKLLTEVGLNQDNWWLYNFIVANGQMDASLLKYLGKHRRLDDLVSNYPSMVIMRVVKVLEKYLNDFDSLDPQRKLTLCSTEPFSHGATFEWHFYKNILEYISKYGLHRIDAFNLRHWWEIIHIYLYGVKALAENPNAEKEVVPYVIKTEIIPVAGHLDRVKFLPDFHQWFLDSMLGNIKNKLKQLADLCQNDPDVRRYMERKLPK